MLSKNKINRSSYRNSAKILPSNTVLYTLTLLLMTQAQHLDISQDFIYNTDGDFGSLNFAGFGGGDYPSPRLHIAGLQYHDDYHFDSAVEDGQRNYYVGMDDGNGDSGNIRFASGSEGDFDHYYNLAANDIDGLDSMDMGVKIVQASKVPTEAIKTVAKKVA